MSTRKASRKPARLRRLVPTLATATVAALIVGAADHALAANLYWDTNGATAGLGTGGPYDWAGDALWNTSSNGGSGTLGGSTTGNDAIFNGNGDSTITVNSAASAADVFIGAGAPSVTLNFSGSSTLSLTSNYFMVGENSSGGANTSTVVFNQSGGTITGNNAEVGRFGSYGTFNLSGGTFKLANTLRIADQSGGGTVGPVGTVNITGGTMQVGSAAVGYRTSGYTATGILTISSGSFTSTNVVTVGAGGAGTVGTVNLDGGTFTALQIKTSAGAASTFNFNGGTLTPTISFTTFFTGLTTANVRDGGAIIDTNGKNITIAQNLLHSTIDGDADTDGGLTKLGAGTLTLTGANDYTGDTLVNAGTLSLANADLDDHAAVNIIAGALLNLTFNDTDVVGSLIYDGTAFGPGTYNAGNTTFITGTGSLKILATAIPTPAALPAGLALMGAIAAGRRRRR